MTNAQHDCDILIQQIAKKRDVFCQWPACNSLVEAGHHIFSRSRLATRYVPLNIIGLCYHYHQTIAHGEPLIFENFMVYRMGDNYFELQQLSLTIAKNFDFKECRKGLRKLLGEL